MVRLKDPGRVSHLQLPEDFNSSMVRLKVIHQWENEVDGIFQFLNGAIKSVNLLNVENVIRYISIPQWSD